MIESWRWFGPLDRIPLSEIAQTGAQGIVTALHERPYGTVWSREDIAARKALIAAAPSRMVWGSDWPHVAIDRMPDTGTLRNLLPKWAPDAATRHAILVDNPQRLYDFPPV